jgi:catechol 2,3-dioxygenase-like lactoylglutathione lyase family enzyme
MPQPQALQLHLFVRDLDAARGFYLDLLGFPIVYESDWFLSLDAGNGVHVCCNARRQDYLELGCGGRGAKLEFRVDNVDDVHRRLSRMGMPFEFPPENKPWGLRSCGVRDPEGYSVWFSTPVPGAAP